MECESVVTAWALRMCCHNMVYKKGVSLHRIYEGIVTEWTLRRYCHCMGYKVLIATGCDIYGAATAWDTTVTAWAIRSY